MATTFDVLFLGNFASINPTEGNEIAEHASSLACQTIGGPGTPLYSNVQTFSPGSTGYAGGYPSNYDQNNTAGIICLAPGREHDADQGTLLAFRSTGAQHDAYAGNGVSQNLTINNQSILRFDRGPALRTAATMEVRA